MARRGKVGSDLRASKPKGGGRKMRGRKTGAGAGRKRKVAKEASAGKPAAKKKPAATKKPVANEKAARKKTAAPGRAAPKKSGRKDELRHGAGKASADGVGAEAGSARGGSTGPLAAVLVVVALLVAAAILPVDRLGPRVAEFFPAGNPVGQLGQALKGLLIRWLGVGCAAVPVVLGTAAVWTGRWGSPNLRRSLAILSLALVVLLPLGGFLVAGEVYAGIVGVAMGEPLRAATGWLGVWVLFGGAVVGTSVAAFHFNPLRLSFQGVVALLRGVRWLFRKAVAGRGRTSPAQVGDGSEAQGVVGHEGSAGHEGAARPDDLGTHDGLAGSPDVGGVAVPAGAAGENLSGPGLPNVSGGGDPVASPDYGVPMQSGMPMQSGATMQTGVPMESEIPMGAGTEGLAPSTGTMPPNPDAFPPTTPAPATPTTIPGAVADQPPSPPAHKPPAHQPLGHQPSAHRPPAHQPLGHQPSADQPPAHQPPAPQPPADQPPQSPGEIVPPTTLLTAPTYANRADMEQELDALSDVLVRTLSTFKIKSTISGRTTGPAVTQYEVVPAAGVKVNRIANLEADLALAMRARSIRIVAPIPGKGAVGVEIPNPSPELVRLREIIDAPAFARSRGALPLAMGKDLEGKAFVTDLAKMPHALIAGATGSGKSVCLNTIITSLVYRHGPDRLRLLMIDPKMVELSAYADLPHLRHSVVTDPRDAAGVLKWAVLEMERRYALLSVNGVRSLKEFNARVARGTELKVAVPHGPEGDPESWLYEDGELPWIVVVVDELADLMMTVQADVEKPLTQLAQKARAIGIHLLVATQRPSVNVITGLIKANFPCRIAFRVASKTDSRTILDQNGADSLLGHGDMLFLPPGRSEPVRMQGAFVSTEETEALMDWYREQADTPEAVKARVKRNEEDILQQVRAQEDEGADGPKEGSWGDWDALFREAATACIQQGTGSTSLLQRKLRIGYGRAARIVDQLHDAGVLGPPDGSKPREVLVGHEALDEICPS